MVAARIRDPFPPLYLKGPRSKPPLQEARLDIWKSPRSNIPHRGPRDPLQKCSEWAKKGCFLRDLQLFFMRFLRAWRLGWTFKRSKVQPPPTGGSVGPCKRSKVQ